MRLSIWTIGCGLALGAGIAVAAPAADPVAPMSASQAAQVRAMGDELAAGARKGPQGYTEVLGRMLSPQGAVMHHDPALPSDGHLITGADLQKGQSLHDKAFKGLVPDYAYSNVDVRALSDRIYVSYDQTGTLPGGAPLRSTVINRLQVRDGKIVDVLVSHDPVQNAPLLAAQRALAAGAK